MILFFQNCAEDFDPDMFGNQVDQGSNVDSTPPEVVANSENMTVGYGEPFTVSFAAAGSNLSYTWYKDGTPLAGGPQSTFLQIQSATMDHSGTYRLCAQNSLGQYCQEISVEVTELVTIGPPEIISHSGFLHEGNYFVYLQQGTPLNLEVTANGEELNYQWAFRPSGNSDPNGFQNITGATGPQYSIPSSNTSHSGTYRITVSNAAGSDYANIQVIIIGPIIIDPINIGF